MYLRVSAGCKSWVCQLSVPSTGPSVSTTHTHTPKTDTNMLLWWLPLVRYCYPCPQGRSRNKQKKQMETSWVSILERENGNKTIKKPHPGKKPWNSEACLWGHQETLNIHPQITTAAIWGHLRYQLLLDSDSDKHQQMQRSKNYKRKIQHWKIAKFTLCWFFWTLRICRYHHGLKTT